MYIRQVVLVFVLLVGLFHSAGCGGGGGSGGGSARTGVRILHAALEVPPVDILPSGAQSAALQTARFAQATQYAPIGTGSQIISITTTQRSAEVLANLSFTVSKGERRSILIAGGVGTLGLKINALLDLPPTAGDGTTWLRIVHGAVGAAAIRSIVDGALFHPPVGFGDASPYQELASGVRNVEIQRVADGHSLGVVPVSLASKGVYTLLVAGQADYFITLPLFSDL